MNTSITTDSILSTSGLLQQNSSHLHCRHKERSDLQPNSITSTLRRLVTHSDWKTSRRLSDRTRHGRSHRPLGRRR